MDLNREFARIESFFQSISEEEFEKILEECGNGSIKPTDEIARLQGGKRYSGRSLYENIMNGETFSDYDVCEDGTHRNEAA